MYPRTNGSRLRIRCLPVVAVAALACGDAGPVEPPTTPTPPPTPSSVNVSPGSVAFAALGDTAQLTSTVLDQNGQAMQGQTVTWASSAPAVATVSASGLVTSAANGSATITATAGSARGSAAVTVAQAAASLSVTPDSLVLTSLGDTARLTAEVLDANGSVVEGAAVSWASADESVAVVDSSGLVAAVANGRTTVTAASDDFAATVQVEVLSFSTDREVLEHFYRTTGGEEWRWRGNWMTNRPLDEWVGVDTDASGRVIAINLPNNNLRGRLPAPVGTLTRLERLVLWSNHLTGPIPQAWGKLSNLRVLDLDQNLVEGRIPAQIGDMAAMDTLVMAGNRLAGPIPAEIGRLSNLRKLVLRRNELSGPLPAEIGNATRLSIIDLLGNAITSIPAELGNLTNLVELNLAENELTGPIPPELGRLSRLTELWLHRNRLSGSIPPEMGNLTNVRDFVLGENELTGSIPPELGRLASLERLWLNDNPLTGPIPPELGQLSRLRILYLMRSMIEGRIPLELGNLAALEDLWIFETRVSGPIPPELGQLSRLRDLSLSHNRLTGTIPAELGQLAVLEALSLSANELEGRIPPELGNLAALEDLRIFENPELSGPIPPELGQLRQLKNLVLSSNRLTGTIPAELGQLAALETLVLSSNELEGPLPPELGALTSLLNLDLYHNPGITGSIPAAWGEMRGLRFLYLSSNPNMRGVVPATLSNLGSMRELDLSGTGLCHPDNPSFQTWLRTVDYVEGGDCTVAEIQRQALLQLYDETEGDSWANAAGWDGGSSVDGWHGVTATAGRVRRLELPGNRLRGELGSVLSNLGELVTLDLTDNDLSGGLDPAYAGVGSLRDLWVAGNSRMAGVIPGEFVESELETLTFGGSGLCASPGRTFQQWLAGLERAEGPNCENPAEIRLDLLASLTQSVQTPFGDVRTVAGRDALLRVFLTATPGPAFHELPVSVAFTRGGSVLHATELDRGTDLLVEDVDEADLRASYNAVVPGTALQPGVEMTVEADAEGIALRPRSATSLSVELDVVDVPPMDVTVVPVLYADNPDSTVLEWTDRIADDSPEVGLLKYAFPFTEFSARSRDPYVTSTDPTQNGWGITLELAAVHSMEDAAGYWYAAADSRDDYVRGIAILNGWVSFGKPWATELAHEVGHSLDLLHAPCGDPASLDPAFPYPDGSTGVWGYDFRDGSLVSPVHRRDIMGYCYDRGWLSDYHFERVIDVREKKEGGTASRAVAAGPARPETETLLLWGGVREGKLRIEPVHALNAAPKLPEGPGPYRLEGRGFGGEVEFSLSFAPDEDKFGNKYFFFFVPVEADWEDSLDSITLTGPEGEVTIDGEDRRSVTVVTDPSTGRIRAILRDWEGPLPAALGDVRSLKAKTTNGIREAVRPDT